ncbi:hypothetical protein NM208_g9748 [Fusarium decemcellulare]|uniref:Uncharacterized protein n=1 Tax=Fusarium decemcellulare TaxID=57161 RepID=A0ACC1S0K3_9HYPO|nr:hypothetical protein NM208_g9748 [Fusarium decemcellulare]
MSSERIGDDQPVDSNAVVSFINLGIINDTAHGAVDTLKVGDYTIPNDKKPFPVNHVAVSGIDITGSAKGFYKAQVVQNASYQVENVTITGPDTNNRLQTVGKDSRGDQLLISWNRQ